MQKILNFTEDLRHIKHLRQIYRGLFKSQQAAKITPITIILPAVIEFPHMYMYSLKDKIASFFPNFPPVVHDKYTLNTSMIFSIISIPALISANSKWSGEQ